MAATSTSTFRDDAEPVKGANSAQDLASAIDRIQTPTSHVADDQDDDPPAGPAGLARVARFIEERGPKVTFLENGLCSRCLRTHRGANRPCVTVYEAAGQLQDSPSRIKTPGAIISTISKAATGERSTRFPSYLTAGHENHDGRCLDPCEIEFFISPPTKLEREHVRRYDADVRNAREALIHAALKEMDGVKATIASKIIEATKRLHYENTCLAVDLEFQLARDKNGTLRQALKDVCPSDREYRERIRMAQDALRSCR
jgi:hypothetical protein